MNSKDTHPTPKLLQSYSHMWAIKTYTLRKHSHYSISALYLRTPRQQSYNPTATYQ